MRNWVILDFYLEKLNAWCLYRHGEKCRVKLWWPDTWDLGSLGGDLLWGFGQVSCPLYKALPICKTRSLDILKVPSNLSVFWAVGSNSRHSVEGEMLRTSKYWGEAEICCFLSSLCRLCSVEEITNLVDFLETFLNSLPALGSMWKMMRCESLV